MVQRCHVFAFDDDVSIVPNALAAVALIEPDRASRDRLQELRPKVREGGAGRAARSMHRLCRFGPLGLFLVRHCWFPSAIVLSAEANLGS